MLADPGAVRDLNERARSREAGVVPRTRGWGGYLIGDVYAQANEG